MEIYHIKNPSPELIAFREASDCFARASEVSGNMKPGHIGEDEAQALTYLLQDEMERCKLAVVSKPPVTLETLAEHAECVAFLAEMFDRNLPSIQSDLSRLQLAVDAFLKVTLNKVPVEQAA
jgi:hypothetical protein